MRALRMVRVTVGLWAVTIWQALLGLITTPFLVHHLGAAEYGIFAVITIVSTYLLNLEIGFGHATLQFVARAHAAGDTEQEARVITTSLAVFTVAGAMATTIALVGSSFVEHHFVHGRASGPLALDAIRLGALTVFGSLLASFGGVALQGLNRFAVAIRIKAVFTTASSVGSIVTVTAGGGLRSVLVVQLALNVLLTLTQLIAVAHATAAKLVPRFHRPTFVAMAKYGVAILVAGLAYQVLLQGPPTVLAGYSTTTDVASYAVPAMIMQQIVFLLGSASFAFAPFASAESVRSDRGRLSEIFRANVRVTLLLAAPIAAYLVLLGKPLLTGWIGAAFAAQAATPLAYLAVAALFLAMSAPPADVLRGLGYPQWVAVFTTSAAAVAVLGSFGLVQAHGAAGVAAALALAVAVGTSLLLLFVAALLLTIRPLELGGALAGPFLAAAFAALLFAVGAKLTSGLAGALLTGVVGACAYAAAVIPWVLDDREKSVLSQLRPQWRRGAEHTA